MKGSTSQDRHREFTLIRPGVPPRADRSAVPSSRSHSCDDDHTHDGQDKEGDPADDPDFEVARVLQSPRLSSEDPEHYFMGCQRRDWLAVFPRGREFPRLDAGLGCLIEPLVRLEELDFRHSTTLVNEK